MEYSEFHWFDWNIFFLLFIVPTTPRGKYLVTSFVFTVHCAEVKRFDVILMLPRFVHLKYCKKVVDLFASQFRNHVFWNEELIYMCICV